MNEHQAARWAKIRNKGRNQFMVTCGLLACGISLTVIFSLVELISNNVITPMYLILRLFVFSVIGIIIANKIWENKERKFQALEKQRALVK